MTALQTFIENFTAQQNEFRHAPSQRHAQPCPNVAIADPQPFEFFQLPAEIRNMIYQQILLAADPWDSTLLHFLLQQGEPTRHCHHDHL